MVTDVAGRTAWTQGMPIGLCRSGAWWELARPGPGNEDSLRALWISRDVKAVMQQASPGSEWP